MMSKHDSEHAPESGKPEPNLSRCSRDILPRLLTAALRKLGARVGRHPFWFIAATMVLTLIYGSAIFRNIVYITNIEYLYIPTNAESWHDRAVSEEFFHMNFSGEFQPDRSSRFGSFAHVLVYPKDGGTVLRRESFDEVLRIDAMIRNITIPGPGQKQPALKYADLCARWGNDCFHTDAVKIANVVDDVEAGRVNLTFPVFFDEKAFDYIILPGSIGKPVLDGDVVLSTPAVGMYFILKAGTPDELALGREWEKEFVRQMQAISKTSSMVDVYYESRDTVEHEFDSLKDFVPLQGFLAGLIVCIFSVVCCMMTDWVRAKPMLAVFGVASTVMATITAFGFLMSLGYPATTILCITPFLMLGIGMDDTFLMLAAWRKTSVHASVEHRVQETYAEAAVSMTITSLTNVLSFLIGATSSFRVLNIFCMYSGLSILFLYLYQITFFGGWMAFYGRLEKANRHTFTMRKIITYNEAAKQGRGTWYRMLCTGGHEPDDDFDEGAEGATNHAVMLFFRNCVAKTLTKPVAKIMVGIIFICYVAGGLYGVLQLEEGLSLKRLVSDYSYYVDFYDKRFSEFMDYPYRVPIVVAGHVDYSDRTVQDDMERLLERIENHTFYANSNFTDSWLRKFLKFAEMANNHGANIIDLSNETTFNENLRGVLNSGDNNKNALDVVFDDGGRIIASRFIVQIYDLKKLPDLKDCMLFLRHVFKEEFPNYNLTAFNPVFSFAELLIGATNTAIQTVGIAAVVMLIIALIMIPESKCAIYVGFSLVSIELGVLGYMSLWGVNLDAISVGCLVMCIGFSVDFSAHVTHSFISSPESTNILKLQDAIEKAGLPILQGATSSVLGVIAMLKIPAYAYLIFVKTIFLVMIFGAVHGILFLPVLLTLTESNGEKKKTDSNRAVKRIASPQTDLSLIRRDEFSDSSFRQDEGNDYVSFMGFKLHDAKKKNRVSGSSSDESSGIGMDPKSSSSESVDSKEVDEFVDADEPLNNGSSRLMSQVSHDSCL